MLKGFTRLLVGRGIPREWILALETPLASGLLAKGAIATELSLAFLLWWPPTRRAALWVGLFFHLTISIITPIYLFTAEMLVAYILFVTPDHEARTLRVPQSRDPFARVVKGLDWFGRYRVEHTAESTWSVVDRDGSELRGPDAVACLFGTLPLAFPAWPFAAILAAFPGGLARR